MDDPSRVEVFDAAQHLIEQIGQPLVVQLHLNDLAQVGIHQLHNQVADRTETVQGSAGGWLFLATHKKSNFIEISKYLYILTHLGTLLMIFVE